MPLQLTLPFHPDQAQDALAPSPAPTIRSLVAIPHWYGHPPPSADDFRAAELERDAALAAWQAAGAAFDLAEPSLPVLWSNIAEAQARAKRRDLAIRHEWRRLQVARERVGRMICLMPPPASALELVRRGQIYFDSKFPELETLAVPAPRIGD